MRKLIGGAILALVVVGFTVGMSVAAGVWWAGPAVIGLSAGLVGLVALGFYLLDG